MPNFKSQGSDSFHESVREEAQAILTDRVRREIADRRAVQSLKMRALGLAHATLQGVLEGDQDYRKGMAELWSETIQELRRTEQIRFDGLASGRSLGGLTVNAALKLMGVGNLQADMVTRPHLDVFGPPYVDRWSHLDGHGMPHARQEVRADAGTGEIGFAYRIFPARGDIACGAAVWVEFMRQAPGVPPGQGPPGIAQVRAYVPYNFMWHNQSGMEAAHNEAGFGVYVLSWDLGGGDRIVEQDYSYLAWNNTTDWNWNQGNPSFPGTDADFALYPPAPEFPIRPGRIYRAAIWCFGSGSAAGQVTEWRASLTEAIVAANVRFVVVEQQ